MKNFESCVDKRDAKPYPLSVDLIRSLPRGILEELCCVEKICRKFQNEFLNEYLKKNPNPQDETLDFKLLKELNRRQFFSLWLPRFLGGQGYNPLSMTIFNEIIGGQCLGVANIIGAHYFGFGLLALSHNYKLMKRIGREIALGEKNNEPCLLSAAVTEPTAGTDREDLRLLRKAELSCWAEKENSGYKIYGKKIFISNATWARYHIVVTTTQKEHPEKETLILAVPADSKGLTASSPFKKWGQNSCPASEVHFQNCWIKTENVALSRDNFSSDSEFLQYSSVVTDNLLAQSRAGVASMAAGVCAAVLSQTEELLKNFPEHNQEWLQAKISKLIKNSILSRTLAWEASILSQFSGPQEKMLNPFLFKLLKYSPSFIISLLGSGMNSSQFSRKMRTQVLQYKIDRSLGLSSLAKFSASDMAHESCLIAMEVFGVEPFLKTLRDCKLLQIYEGTNQLNQLQTFYGLTKAVDIAAFAEVPHSSNKRTEWKTDLNKEKLKILRNAFDICYQHSLNRKQGGVLISAWTEHGQNLGSLKSQLESLEVFLQHANSKKEKILLSMKLDVTLIPFVSLCMQLMGGKGYLLSSNLPALFDQALNLRSQSSAPEFQNLNFLGDFP